MLRRATKQATDSESKTRSKGKTKRSVNINEPLGSKKRRDDRDQVLESLVLGGEDEIIQQLEKSSQRLEKPDVPETKDKKSTKKPVWNDEDDTEGSILLTKARKFSDIRRGDETKIKKGEYSHRLKAQFEKVSAAPNWSKLPSEREKNSDDDDSDYEDLVQKTGTYIKSATILPKTILQIKSCTDINKESPHKGRLSALEFHPSAQVALTAGMNQTLSLFQVDGKTNSKIQSLFFDTFPIHCAHFTRDGEQIILSSKYNCIKYFDMIQGSVIDVPLKGAEEHGFNNNFVVSPDGKYLVFLADYGSMHFLSAKTKEWLFTLRMNGKVKAVDFTSDGSQMFSHGEEGQVYVWNMRSRDCIHKFYDEGCTYGTSVAVSPNDQYIACGSDSGVVNLYERSLCMTKSDPKPLKAIMNLTSNCTSTKFNSTSEILAIASDSAPKAVKMVHVASQTVFANFPDNLDSNFTIPTAVDFSLNSGYFTVGTHKGKALLYRLKHYSNY